MELELIMSDVAIRYLGDLIFIANFKIFSRGGGGGLGFGTPVQRGAHTLVFKI